MKTTENKTTEAVIAYLRENLKTANHHIRTLNNEIRTPKIKKNIGYWEGYADATEHSIDYHHKIIAPKPLETKEAKK